MKRGFDCEDCEYLKQDVQPRPIWWYCDKYKVFLCAQARSIHESATRCFECVKEESGI